MTTPRHHRALSSSHQVDRIVSVGIFEQFRSAGLLPNNNIFLPQGRGASSPTNGGESCLPLVSALPRTGRHHPLDRRKIPTSPPAANIPCCLLRRWFAWRSSRHLGGLLPGTDIENPAALLLRRDAASVARKRFLRASVRGSRAGSNDAAAFVRKSVGILSRAFLEMTFRRTRP